MEQVNALKLRNNLGEILDRLNRTGKPILVTKGRKLRAVLVTPDDFEKRFLDVRAREERERFLNEVDSLRKKRKLRTSSVELLRRLRGYEK
ncbi:MAG: type II toxin-antitoxin system Phd/YefM family antitoxin [Deltaproteobacteria bacterium]|nr:type II toxin-antitoxin system Phd/YefM family antitoxin [Deltaproteobacteria bacterium]MBW1950345.1 type II toxin-antitoxin system Phd/YefM family antitoxin [Deltaproteobacteria bacterium]MBW2103911.1 type II toxin-antitoxin system Phd/YefM family antitoxin [Deltaproteobacteria bacterium]MBW2349005.1 type II toxin-antitoxin system Phd/YefM family antitoxin [Deltaproteobacteria bacterium]